MSWVGLIAPPSTPSTIVDNINKSVRKLLREKATSELLNTLNMDVVATSPAETTEYLAAERTRWGNIITKSGISFD
jgi:tripartite-type tricarboxylate transporter receptor subunit TctC